ncbi:uncharacterized protein J3R85_003230 [Psidium guajava]|nr:uncharacterized protein J3R85_003230 [Psidium guajava]
MKLMFDFKTTYDPRAREFIINTPSCNTHSGFFPAQYQRDQSRGPRIYSTDKRCRWHICPNIRIADCGHKIGLNGVDNGRIWFDDVRIPRENLLNSVADVSPDGEYLSAIKDPDQRFAAFLAPLTAGRINIAVSAIYSAKIGLAIAIRYALSRQAFSIAPNQPEVLLLDYPSHQRRLLPLLAKTLAPLNSYCKRKDFGT